MGCRSVVVLLLIVAVSGVGVVVGSLLFGPVSGIKGSYLLIGAIVGAALFYVSDDGRSDSGGFDLSERRARQAKKAVFILIVMALLLSVLPITRSLVLLAVLPLGYALLLVQVLGHASPASLLTQVIGLYVVSPLTLYLKSGFYFGHGDLLYHTRIIGLLKQGGTVAAFADSYAIYSKLPALHSLVAALSWFTGLEAYDAAVLLGIWCFSLTIAAMFFLAGSVLSVREAVFVALILSVLSDFSFYSTYFFPQALATGLLVWLFYVVLRGTTVSSVQFRKYKFTEFLVIGALLFTHHLTLILLLLVMGSLYAPSVLRGLPGRSSVAGINAEMPRFTPFLLAAVAGLSYQAYQAPAFIRYFVGFLRIHILTPEFFVSSTGSGGRAVIGYGADVSFHTVKAALMGLGAADGIYYIALFAGFVLGVVTVIGRADSYLGIAGFLLTGALASVVILPTPVVNLTQRVSLAVAPFFAMLVGIGARRILDSVKGRSYRTLAPVLLLTALCVTAPLVAGLDLYGLHAGPNLYERYSTPEQQVEFSNSEFDQLEATSSYIDRRGTEVSSLWITTWALEHFGTEATLPSEISERGIAADESLVYRTAWGRHQVGSGRGETLYFTRDWLRTAIERENKVYTTGGVGVLQDSDGVCLSTRSCE